MLTRISHGLLSLLGLAACLMPVWIDLHMSGVLRAGLGEAMTLAWISLSAQFPFFTFMSNALVCLTSLRLAVGGRPQAAWQVLRITALVCIVITGVVFNLLLDDGHRQGLYVLSNALAHIITPIAAPLVALLVGPREATWGRLGWSTLVPICWLVITVIRGLQTGWYPYTIIDPTLVGWAGAAGMVGAILVAYFVIGAALVALDSRLRRRSQPGPGSP